MKINFYKYQGTGNDFVIVDNRDGLHNDISAKQVKHICDRHFGIGADGLMLLQNKQDYDFEMVYFNSNGMESSMCGNGGRCLVKFANKIYHNKSTFTFIAVDGIHEAEICETGIVKLKMNDVHSVEKHHNDYVLNTGSPHYVINAVDVRRIDVVNEGRKIRNSHDFKEYGINVNFVEIITNDKIFVRTYERGVEDETLSCGTGVTAAALVNAHNQNGFNQIEVQTPGGKLSVEFDKIGNNEFQNIWLCGAAELVFEGFIEV